MWRFPKLGVAPNHPSHYTILVLKPMLTWESPFEEPPTRTWDQHKLIVAAWESFRGEGISSRSSADLCQEQWEVSGHWARTVTVVGLGLWMLGERLVTGWWMVDEWWKNAGNCWGTQWFDTFRATRSRWRAGDASYSPCWFCMAGGIVLPSPSSCLIGFEIRWKLVKCDFHLKTFMFLVSFVNLLNRTVA